ncbi:MAG: peptidylprolyl isomerase [Candidatus Symbiothrix sp.]|jgi:cyclophilin family peptidyl-prolyl cis-trans isomerase|nr:peptidylprolyl isomerase [Candidatus Symbiothrix sp.]
MKTYYLILILLFGIMANQANAQTYVIQTTKGDITVKLYDKTPLHQANFEQLVEKQAYDSVLFHRVIQNFMIQTGDLSTRMSPISLESDETIPAEFVTEYIHKKGALAAARTGDFVNPEKRSSPTQFYIVEGHPFSETQLDALSTQTGRVYTEEEKEIYKTLGGTPHLDGAYTVFGEVTDGLNVVEAIGHVQTAPGDRPVEDIRILSVKKL